MITATNRHSRAVDAINGRLIVEANGNAKEQSRRAWSFHRTTMAVPGVTPDTHRSARVLIVARPALSREISTTLTAAGYEVHRTPDAASAVEVARRLRPHLAIVANEIPGSSGQNVAKLLRSSQSTIPVILLGMANDDPQTGDLVQIPAHPDPQVLLRIVAARINPTNPVREPHAG